LTMSDISADIESSRPANEMKTTEKIGGNG